MSDPAHSHKTSGNASFFVRYGSLPIWFGDEFVADVFIQL